jgi:DNA primase
LTPDQIRLINRLTKKYYSAFDGDAGLVRASVRIDLILEEGMNVKVCTFPDGANLTVLLRRRLMMI